MADDMLHDCIEFARSKMEGVKDWRSEGDGVVLAIKEALDAKYLPQWHVAVGKHFGSKITHDAKHFVSFYLGDCALGAAAAPQSRRTRAVTTTNASLAPRVQTSF